MTIALIILGAGAASVFGSVFMGFFFATSMRNDLDQIFREQRERMREAEKRRQKLGFRQ